MVLSKHGRFSPPPPQSETLSPAQTLLIARLNSAVNILITVVQPARRRLSDFYLLRICFFQFRICTARLTDVQ